MRIRWLRLHCVCLLALQAQAQQLAPDFRKLAPTPLCGAGVEFARAHSIPIEGIERASGPDKLIPGDSITALITLFERGRHTSQWLLMAQATERTNDEAARSAKSPLVRYVGRGDKMQFSQSLAPLTLRLAGPFQEPSAGRKRPAIEDQSVRISVNQGFLGLGLEQAAAATHRFMQNNLHGSFAVRERPFTAAEITQAQKSMAALHVTLEEQRAIAGANLALESYADLAQETPGLDTLLFKVVKPLSIWSLVWHLGAKVSLNLETKYVAPAQIGNWCDASQTPCFTYPLSLYVNDQAALLATLVVVPPRPPLLECAGIVGMLAENPTDKQTYLFLRIISARRGPNPARNKHS